MKEHFRLNRIVIYAFVAAMLGDIVTTLMVFAKHSAFGTDSEMNPLVTYGVPFWVLIVISIAAVFIAVRYFYRFYRTTRSPLIRYLLVTGIVFAVLIHLACMKNNIYWFMQDTEKVKPLPEAERTQAYMNGVMHMEVVKEQIPEPVKQAKIPLMFYIIGYNMMNFIIWLSFEKDNGVGIYGNRR